MILRSHDDQKVLTIAHPANITAAKFSPNFRYVASIDEKGNLLVHEIHEYKLSLAFQYSHMYLGAKTLDWTCDEKKICIAGNGQKRYGKVISLDTGT